MERYLQKEKLEEMMKKPVRGKKIGIVHLQMVRESRSLYGMGRLTQPEKAVEVVRPLLELADREMLVVMSLSVKMEPLAIEIAAIGGMDSCTIDIRCIFKHALLNNAACILCFHNHTSGNPEPSIDDCLMTKKLQEAGKLLGVVLADHIIIGSDGFYSFMEHGKVDRLEPDSVA